MSHDEVIDQWPNLSAFAEDIGVAYGTAKAMRRRGRIPSSYWAEIVRCAAKRQLDDVTLERLARLAAHARSPAEEQGAE